MMALNSLGVVNQKMNDYETARLFHERHEDLARMFDVVEEVKKANVELYKVYMVIAIRFDDDGKSEEALDFFNKCLGSAKNCWDKGAEGEANGRIGSLLLHRE